MDQHKIVHDLDEQEEVLKVTCDIVRDAWLESVLHDIWEVVIFVMTIEHVVVCWDGQKVGPSHQSRRELCHGKSPKKSWFQNDASYPKTLKSLSTGLVILRMSFRPLSFKAFL